MDTIREREDPVSLRLAAPVPPAQLLRITREMLRSFAMSRTLRAGIQSTASLQIKGVMSPASAEAMRQIYRMNAAGQVFLIISYKIIIRANICRHACLGFLSVCLSV